MTYSNFQILFENFFGRKWSKFQFGTDSFEIYFYSLGEKKIRDQFHYVQSFIWGSTTKGKKGWTGASCHTFCF